MSSSTGPSRQVIVNEADDRKLGVYTEGDTDATIDGVAVLGEQATNTLRPFSIDASGTLRISLGNDATTPIFVNPSSTAIIPSSVSGTTSAVSTSGATIVSPETGRNIKVYAFSLTTTGVVSIAPRFTNGSGASPTELWRMVLQAPSAVNTGANLAVTPPGYLFATGTGNTLSLVLDSATLVHYSVAYFKETA